MGRLTQKQHFQTSHLKKKPASCSFPMVFKQRCYATSSCRNTINNWQTAQDPAGGSGLACSAARLLRYPADVECIHFYFSFFSLSFACATERRHTGAGELQKSLWKMSDYIFVRAENRKRALM